MNNCKKTSNSHFYLEQTMAKFITILKYTSKLEEVDLHRNAHMKWVKEQFTTGYFLASGKLIPPNGGIIIAGNCTLPELNSLLNSDPFVIHSVACYDILEIEPSMAATGFEGFLEK